ncbi:hypothetical protein KAU39_07845 [bacterium]|nr:hypothetical protein [bacterium]
MKHSLKTGLSFGLSSGVITTLGLIIGLNASTKSKAVIIGAIIIMAVSDAFSDAMGIHFSEESENKHCRKEIWESTGATFLCKFIFAMTFIIPVLFLKLFPAIVVSIIWGVFLLVVFSLYLAKEQKVSPKGVIVEHLIVILTVIILTHNIGLWVGRFFK